MAFCTLVEHHQQSLLNFFCRMGAGMDAEDMTQETFVRLYKYRERYVPRARFTTFLYTLARNVWRDAMRKRLRHEVWMDRQVDGAQVPDPRRSPESWAACMDVRAAVQGLSEKLRSVLVLRIYQGLDYREIAEVLDIPTGTVKSRMNLAVKALEAYFEVRKNR